MIKRVIASLRSPGLRFGEKAVLFFFSVATFALAVAEFVMNGHP